MPRVSLGILLCFFATLPAMSDGQWPFLVQRPFPRLISIMPCTCHPHPYNTAQRAPWSNLQNELGLVLCLNYPSIHGLEDALKNVLWTPSLSGFSTKALRPRGYKLQRIENMLIDTELDNLNTECIAKWKEAQSPRQQLAVTVLNRQRPLWVLHEIQHSRNPPAVTVQYCST